MTYSAFISSKAIGANAVLPTVARLPFQASLPYTSSTSLSSWYRGAAVMADYSSEAISYFTSTRIPAALVAGSSLTALFTLKSKAKFEDIGKRSRLENFCIVAYHMLSLFSFLLSLNVILTCTATSNTLLLGMDNPMARSAYELLRRELDYEFIFTQWSFYISLLTFLGGILVRALLEFDVLKRSRLPTASTFIFAILSLVFHVVSFVNRRLHCWPDLVSMTIGVVKMYIKRSLYERSPCELASLICLLASFFSIGLVYRKIDRLSMHDDGADEQLSTSEEQ